MGKYLNQFMNFEKKILNLFNNLEKIKKKTKKKIIFSIVNTTKKDSEDYYFVPSRIFKNTIVFGIVVFKDKFAKLSTQLLDGKVDYIMVDAEKKILPRSDEIPGNIERRVRENIKNSKLLVFKGNDLTVDSIDLFLTYYFNDDIRGLGGKKITIIGSGNIGSKLALILLERGSKVIICRRDFEKSKLIAKTINLIKPQNTVERAVADKDIENASKNTDILIGATSGKPTINAKMINSLKNTAIIIDAGKGTLQDKAIELAQRRNIKIFRTDITAALSGLIDKSLEMEKMMEKNFNIKKEKNYTLVSQGLLGSKNSIIVDDVNNPKAIYGICNGKGDFFRKLDNKQSKIILGLKKKYNLKV